MHKIERLLQTLAPKGVEFRKLGEVCDFQNGFAFQRKNFRNTGLPIIRISNIQNDRLLLDEVIYFSLNDYKGTNFEPFKITKGDILIAMSGATTGKIGILTFDATLYLNQRVGKFKPNITKLNNKFLYYFLLTKINFLYSLAGGGAQPNLSSNQILQQITIPIPPLEIQQEIVKILDAFTELNTELKARKKQYQYYQNMLLDFKDIHLNHKDAKEKLAQKSYPKRLKTLIQTLAPKGVEFRKLGEVCESTNKKTLKISEVSEVKNKGMYPVINSGRDLYGYYHDFNNDGENITIASRGEYAGFINYFNEKFFAGGLCYPYKVKDTNELLTKFLYFYLKTNEIQIMENLVSRGSIPALNKADIETLTIPIPPLEIQQEIVKILDQFSILTTDLLAGIPAEIKARKKQYEYYREKLLTFKPLTPNKEVKK
ncbi:restriction endonuclease subunit S [Helicobacter pylori]|uniref:restriction endonuclease subunit S n=1 Tax=Helicobacter pylori TaxID=210 RepID=UPI0029296D52|nr:restriction endonuclease subunit S [Helicobacter pylori]MDU9794265.1 restriction endonuclease subunit S [Helicobacter pylori]